MGGIGFQRRSIVGADHHIEVDGFVAAAFGDGALGAVHWLFASWLGQLILFLATWALFHHLLGGIRHFIFDTGRGFDRQTRFGLAWGNLVGGIVLTIVVWAAFVWF